jgi:hypothetical protein
MMDTAQRALVDVAREWTTAIGARELAQMRDSLEAIRALQDSRHRT